MIDNKLMQALENVTNRASFLDFVRALSFDRRQAAEEEARLKHKGSLVGLSGWENTTIEHYLESAAACVEDHGEDSFFSEQPSWRVLAEFLYAGKIYE